MPFEKEAGLVGGLWTLGLSASEGLPWRVKRASVSQAKAWALQTVARLVDRLPWISNRLWLLEGLGVDPCCWQGFPSATQRNRVYLQLGQLNFQHGLLGRKKHTGTCFLGGSSIPVDKEEKG